MRWRPFRVGLGVAPEVNNSVGYCHAQMARVRPRLLLQFVKQLLSNHRIGKGHFEFWPGAGDHLDQIRATDDTDEMAGLVDDRNALDLMFLEQRRNFM